ncbi:MAG: ABC transporter ATP-binding protein [Armatimonadetes bacterium]|nr:ABC transporter ATP-binding protein [Armatimonadota bacterium]
MVTDQPKPLAIQFENVCKSFPSDKRDGSEPIVVLDHLTFSVEDHPNGEFVAILGPSGSGKSTVLNMLSGLLEPDSGIVQCYGKPITDHNPDAVTVPQSYTCFPWLSVLENVRFGLDLQGKSRSEANQIAEEYLAKVGLADRAEARVNELSGGMQQRVAIARALAVKPRLLLMDEPFGALDASIRTDMQQMLLKIWEEERSTIFFITHDITEALLLADRILVLSTKPAKIIQDLIVPFPRPRSAEIQFDDLFQKLSQSLIALLKTQGGTGGQVRVSL